MGARERFVLHTLETEGRKLDKNQGATLRSSLNIRSGHILSARSIAVRGSDEMNGQLTYTHAIYERFLDMKRHGGRKMKRRKIHNRFIFGTYSSIAKRLMYGFTEEVAAIYRDAEGK